MALEGNLSSEQLQFFDSHGYLVLESFARPEEVESMRKRMEQLLDEFDFSSAASIFSTKNQQQTTNDHFFESAEKISFFWEEKGFDENGNLKQPKQLSINKVGHALHEKDTVFNKFSSSAKVSSMLRSFGYQRPVCMQSMYIFKQPGIGGEVVPHQDNSFLYTEPTTCTGLWLALEDATIVNGCLWAIPGSHKNGLVRRFLRDETGVHFDKPSPCYNQKDFVPLEVKAGSLVVIHGDLIHQSFENQSSKSRHAYSLHVVDTNGCKWAEDNWLGFIIDFLSKATLIGFMAGAAIIVSLQQLKGLLGITHFTTQMAIVPVLTSVFHTTKEWSWQTILMGFCFLVFLLLTRHTGMKKPKLFWVSAGAPLLSVIISTLIVFAIKGQNHGISVIGKLEEGLNPPSWNMLHFSGSYLGLVIKTGIVTGILSLTEGIAVGRTFAALKNYQVDGNKEMIAIGLMNIVGSSTSCYVTTGAFSRSAVNHNAGSKTAVSNIVMAVTVMVTLLFLMPLFQYTPNVVLGAIIVTAVIGLIDIPAALRIWKIDKFDFLVLLCAFFGVIFISVQDGLAIAIGISILKVLLQITRPKTVMLGNIPGTGIYRNLDHYKEARSVTGFLILSIEAPINFANTTYLKERISRWIQDCEEEGAKKQSGLRFVVLDLSPVSAIDTSGISLFKDLNMALEKKGLELVLVNPIGEVLEKLQRADETKDMMRPDCLFLTVEEAVASLSSSIKYQIPELV